MMKPDFFTAVESLCVYYGQAELVQEKGAKAEAFQKQLAAWYPMVKDLPAGKPLEYVLRRVKEEHDLLPRNLPKAFLRFWGEFRSNYPDLCAPKTMESRGGECPDQCSNGLWHVSRRQYNEKTGKEMISRVTFRCARCYRSDLAGIPAATISAILRAGYVIEGPMMDKATRGKV